MTAVNVFLTVDTEFWPHTSDWRENGLAQDIDRDIHGRTKEGDFGIGYQIDILEKHNLKAVFLVEALSPCVTGIEPLHQIVSLIRSRGQDVQLHLHPEWLAWTDDRSLPPKRGDNIRDYSFEEQVILLAKGIENLKACGVTTVRAFRAGNYGADLNTLRALHSLGIEFDTSHNTTYLKSACDIRTADLLLQPRDIEGVREFPISFFQSWPRGYRHAQVCACSSQEMQGALMGAWRRQWYSFVIVSHSFELLKGRKQKDSQAAPDRIVIRRFEKLCRFLDANRDKFKTSGFDELDVDSIPSLNPQSPLPGKRRHTLWRHLEQLTRRVTR